jgi:hypothetical protein
MESVGTCSRLGRNSDNLQQAPCPSKPVISIGGAQAREGAKRYTNTYLNETASPYCNSDQASAYINGDLNGHSNGYRDSGNYLDAPTDIYAVALSDSLSDLHTAAHIHTATNVHAFANASVQ